jgi:hypothetical protein
MSNWSTLIVISPIETTWVVINPVPEIVAPSPVSATVNAGMLRLLVVDKHIKRNYVPMFLIAICRWLLHVFIAGIKIDPAKSV